MSRPLLSAVCERMVALGDQAAYLVTATGRIPALNLYFGFGFLPDIVFDGIARWRDALGRGEAGGNTPLCAGLNAWLSALVAREDQSP